MKYYRYYTFLKNKNSIHGALKMNQIRRKLLEIELQILLILFKLENQESAIFKVENQK